VSPDRYGVERTRKAVPTRGWKKYLLLGLPRNGVTIGSRPHHAQAAGNGVTLEEVDIDLDNGTATYELAGKGADGKMIEIDVLSDGTIEEVEQEISMDNVPDAVKKLLTKYMPKFKADKAEKSTRTNFEVFYEFDGQDENGGELDIEIRSDGKQITIADDSAA